MSCSCADTSAFVHLCVRPRRTLMCMGPYVFCVLLGPATSKPWVHRRPEEAKLAAGYFGVRWYQKWQADKKQTEYITKVLPLLAFIPAHI